MDEWKIETTQLRGPETTEKPNETEISPGLRSLSKGYWAERWMEEPRKLCDPENYEKPDEIERRIARGSLIIQLNGIGNETIPPKGGEF